MKFATTPVILALAAGFAAAQLDDVPECATSCIREYTTGTQIANCGQLDIKCICSNTDFLNGIACCLDKDCDETGKNNAVAFAKQICSTQNVEIPDKVECKSGSSSSTTSAASASGTSNASASGSASASDSSDASKTSTASTQSTATTTQSASQQSGTGAASSLLSPFSGSIGAALAMLLAL